MNRRLISKSYDVLEDLRKSRYYIFIRANGFETIGILTKIDHVYDGSWGVMRKLALGLSLSGDPFEEYLDRKNKRTGELEDLIQMQTDLLVVTARNTNNPDDDDNNNFTYMLDAHSSNQLKDKLDETRELKRVNNALNKKIEETLRMQESYQRQLQVAQSEANSYREKMSNFAEQLGQARARAEYYQTQLKREQINMLVNEGEMGERLKNATYRGELQGKDSADVILEGAKKQIQAKTELDKIIGPTDGVSRDEYQKFEKKILERTDAKDVEKNVAKKPVTKEKNEEEEEE